MIEVNIDPKKRMIVNDEKENVTGIETEREIEEIDQIGIKKENEIEIEKETEIRTGIGKEIEKGTEIEIERKTGRGIGNETEKGNEIEKEIVTEIGIVIVKTVDGAESENENVIVNAAGKEFGVSVKKEKKENQEGLDVQEGEVEVLAQGDAVVTVRRDIVRVLDQ